MTKYKNRSNRNRRRGCSSRGAGGGSKSRRFSNKKNTRRWRQKGCQSGGGSMTGGLPWGPSDIHHTGSGGSIGGMSEVPQSINGNHYSLNTATMSPPQSSNHLVEKGMYGGGSKSKSKSSSRSRSRSRSRRRERRHRKFVGEQRGGMAEYLPETGNTALRGVLETPASVANTLQGDPTAFVTSNPTVQPIAQPVALK